MKVKDITLTREQKVILLRALKRGILTIDEAVIITKPFEVTEPTLTQDQINKLVDAL